MLAVLLAGPALTAAITDAPEVALASREIRVADIALVSGGSEAERRGIERRVVAALPRSGQVAALRRDVLADLVRRRAGLAVTAGAGALTVRYRPQARSDRGGCWENVLPVAAGELITAETVAPAPCSGVPAAGTVRFVRTSGQVRAASDLSAGTYLGRLMPPPAGAVQAGASLSLLSTSGPVTIARPVTTLQAGRPGRRVFVRDEDGQVLSIGLAEERRQ